jgi:hypothetical protein
MRHGRQSVRYRLSALDRDARASLRQRQVERLDWKHLAEEVEGFRRFEQGEVISHLCASMHARLLWEAHPGAHREAWRTQISVAYIFLSGYLEYGPSVAEQILSLFARAYDKA